METCFDDFNTRDYNGSDSSDETEMHPKKVCKMKWRQCTNGPIPMSRRHRDTLSS